MMSDFWRCFCSFVSVNALFFVLWFWVLKVACFCRTRCHMPRVHNFCRPQAVILHKHILVLWYSVVSHCFVLCLWCWDTVTSQLDSEDFIWDFLAFSMCVCVHVCVSAQKQAAGFQNPGQFMVVKIHAVRVCVCVCVAAHSKHQWPVNTDLRPEDQLKAWSGSCAALISDALNHRL